MKFSILIPSLPSRLRTFLPRLMDVLEPQLTSDVELLILTDNRQRSVGAKRNELLRMATGEYLAFIDDDDLVHLSEYVSSILGAMDGSDCIVFDQTVTINDSAPKLCKYGIEYDYTDTPELWTGKPAHTMVWKSELAKLCKFPEINYSEDMDWVSQAWPLIKSQTRIDKILYYYEFNRRTSETRRRRK